MDSKLGSVDAPLVAFFGDFCPIGAEIERTASTWRPFRNLLEMLGGHVVAIANLECALTTCGDGLPFKWANLRASPKVVEAFEGLNLAVVANNHIGDFGADGVRETLDTLTQAKIPYVGFGSTLSEALNATVIPVGARRLGVVALSCPTTNGQNLATPTTPGVAPLAMRTLADAIYRARHSCDALAVYLHWGEEWVHDPYPDQLRLARFAIRCGADAVLGCHSHTIQTYEQYNGRWIFYGLGNLFFGAGQATQVCPTGDTIVLPLRNGPAQRESLVACFRIVPDAGEGRLQLVRTQAIATGDRATFNAVPPEALSFNMARHLSTLRQFAVRHRSMLECPREPAYEATFHNACLNYFPLRARSARIHDGVEANKLSLPCGPLRMLEAQVVSVARRAARHALATARRGRTAGKTLSAEIAIRRKWNADSKRLPLTAAHWELYRIIHRRLLHVLGEFPELVECRDFNDRIQWLKLFDQDPENVRCSDKLGVREYVAERVGSQYLTRVFQTCSRFDEIAFHQLPDSFVLKTTHDSGTVFVVRAKSQVDYAMVGERMTRSLRNVYGWDNGEWAYAFVSPRIMIEEYLDSGGQTPPADYKFYVVNGRVAFMHYISSRGSDTKEQLVSAEGGDLNTPLYPTFKLANDFVCPPCWEEMKEVACKLGKGFKCVRVDLYYCQGRIYCGEMTFWPMFGAYKGDGQRRAGRLLDFDRTTFKPPIYQSLTRPTPPAAE